MVLGYIFPFPMPSNIVPLDTRGTAASLKLITVYYTNIKAYE